MYVLTAGPKHWIASGICGLCKASGGIVICKNSCGFRKIYGDANYIQGGGYGFTHYYVYNQCSLCGGDGVNDCIECSQSGQISCSGCTGSGVISCTGCNSSGSISERHNCSAHGLWSSHFYCSKHGNSVIEYH